MEGLLSKGPTPSSFLLLPVLPNYTRDSEQEITVWLNSLQEGMVHCKMLSTLG